MLMLKVQFVMLDFRNIACTSSGLNFGFFRIGWKSSSSSKFSLPWQGGTAFNFFSFFLATDGRRAIETWNCWSAPVLLYLWSASRERCPVRSLISWSLKFCWKKTVAQVTLLECPVFAPLNPCCLSKDSCSSEIGDANRPAIANTAWIS